MALPTGWWERLDEMDDVEEATLLMRISGRGGRLSRSKSISPLRLRSKSEGGLFIAKRGTQRAIGPTVDSDDDDTLLAGLEAEEGDSGGGGTARTARPRFARSALTEGERLRDLNQWLRSRGKPACSTLLAPLSTLESREVHQLRRMAVALRRDTPRRRVSLAEVGAALRGAGGADASAAAAEASGALLPVDEAVRWVGDTLQRHDALSALPAALALVLAGAVRRSMASVMVTPSSPSPPPPPPVPDGEPPSDDAPLPPPPRPLRKRASRAVKKLAPLASASTQVALLEESGRTAELAGHVACHEVARQYRELYAEYRGHRRSAGLPELRRPRRRPPRKLPRVASEPAPFAAPSAARRRAAAELAELCAVPSSHQHSLHRRVLEAGIPKEGASVSDAAWRSAVRRSAQDEWRAIRGSTNGEEGAPPRPARFRGAPRRQPAPPQPALFASTAAPPLQWSVDAPLLGPSRAV